MGLRTTGARGRRVAHRERRQGRALDSQDFARLAAETASEKKAEDIVALDVGGLLVVTDYFVICTARNDRQVRTIAEEVELKLKQAGLPAIGVEGAEEGKWVLIDFADVVVHVFQPDERDFYRLEKLWSDAPRLSLPAEVVNATSTAVAAQEEERHAAGDTTP
ncbi:MAG: ribosome silencing factor [Anaerosomatales bacterium]|nr:ribosome silencing factor [Anaerosomatales bacterium]